MLNTITVSQLNNYVKSLIENDVRLTFINVSGEISNFKNHFSSGHWYFTLKDANATIRCVMFRSSASRVNFDVHDGMAVILKGKVSLYEKDGQYQFYAEEMHTLGQGDLALQFKQVKEKLEQEGLFDAQSKRPLVKFPKRIAVITSDTGAAVRDILNVTANRYPACEIIICPVLVQGEMAARDMINTLERVYSLEEIDAIIIGRGGGSAEDLHCFNDETLARKIYESPFPVISAVGHETDFTICDFVADVRASTPSHAAELVVPDCQEIKKHLNNITSLLNSRISFKYNSKLNILNSINSIVNVLNFERKIQNKQIDVDRLSDKIINQMKFSLQLCVNKTANITSRIDALSPLKIIARGFTTVKKCDEYITDISKIDVDDIITVKFVDGDIDCIVTEKNVN